MKQSRSVRSSERGETLIEILVSVTILGIIGVALVGGLLMISTSSVVHRDAASSQNSMRNWAESVSSSAYGACNTLTAASFLALKPANLPAGFTASVPSVLYWNGSAFVAGPCTVGGALDTGLIKVTLQLTPPVTPGSHAETLVVVKRKPCTGCGP